MTDLEEMRKILNGFESIVPDLGRQTHVLKTVQPFFDDLWHNLKKFEIRYNDKNYKEGDVLVLREYDASTDTYSGKLVVVKINYIMPDFKGVTDGYVALGFRRKENCVRIGTRL